jgi:hypothetical protein
LDLQLYLHVLWRFRLLVLAGVLLGLTLAFFSVVRVSFEGGQATFYHRQSEVWQSEAMLFVTQRGFPWGRTAPEYVPSSPNESAPPVPASDPTRLSNLATLYAEFAKGDFVQSIVGRKTARLVEVRPVPAPPLSSPPTLPIISIRALGPSPKFATALAQRTSSALVTFVQRQQDEAAIPDAERVQIETFARANGPLLVKGRGKTVPIVVFVATLMASLGLAFILENLKPRISTAARAEGRGARPAAEAPLRSA